MSTNKENTWLNNFDYNNPLIIAGPCSAETEEQVFNVAKQLQNTPVSIFRAGIWKPRTRPGGFEGVGAIGLDWLRNAGKEFGLLTATEVANATHVQLALKHDIDVLWIGARTTVNPFAVQEIADALQGTEKIILIKNPVNPDLSLWLGGIERLNNANIKNIGAIHRGFSTYEKTKYRNIPEWQLVIDLQNKCPELPIICDPSHITGKRSMIHEVSQQALNIRMDGLMIETHCNPDLAWSDAAQQVTPESLLEIISSLKVRKLTDNGDDYIEKISKFRTQIDEADSKLLDILGKRMKIASEIGYVKKEKNVSLLQNERWNEILQKMIDNGKQNGLSEEFILKFYKLIHQESILKQGEVINE